MQWMKNRFPKQRVTVRKPCDYCKNTGYNAAESDGKCWFCKGKGFQESREQLFLCVGGPFNGKFMNETALKTKRKTAAKIGTNDYYQYNSSVRGNRMRVGHSAPACIWVHKSVIPQAFQKETE